MDCRKSSPSTESLLQDLLGSYVPEQSAFCGKEAPDVPRFFEDCALVDAATGRILASRGRGLSPGQSFSEVCGLSSADCDFAHRAYLQSPRLLLRGKRGTILTFAEMSDTTGILLVILPHAEPELLWRALLTAGRDEILASPSYPQVPSAHLHPDAEIYDCISSIFFYADRLFGKDLDTDPARKCLLAAAFVGYRPQLRSSELNVFPQKIFDGGKFIVFLLCVFLSLRRVDGSLQALQDGEQSDAGLCRVEFFKTLQGRDIFQSRKSVAASSFAFSEHPLFQNFLITDEKDRLVLEMRLRDAHLTPAALRALPKWQETLFSITVTYNMTPAS